MKAKCLVFLIAIAIGSVSAQIRYSNDGHFFQCGYDTYTPFSIGSSGTTYSNHGAWSFEHWDGGLDIWKPWPTANCAAYIMFITDDTQFVGIGKRPEYKLDVDGDIALSGTLYYTSDARLKTNIVGLSDCMNNLNKLNGKSFIKRRPEINYLSKINSKDTVKYKTISTSSENKKMDKGVKQFGLLAQEVKEIYPELVNEDSEGYLRVDYIGLIPILIEALKEQNTQILALDKLVKAQTSKTKSASVGSSTDISSEVIQNNELKQNIPNPFNLTTQIDYNLISETKSATLYIYDMVGTQLKSIPILSMGQGSIKINGYELKPGMYLFTLIADNTEVDTKRMILTN